MPQLNDSIVRMQERTVNMPFELGCFLERFLLDKRTGTVELNIKDGKVLSYHVREYRKLLPD